VRCAPERPGARPDVRPARLSVASLCDAWTAGGHGLRRVVI